MFLPQGVSIVQLCFRPYRSDSNFHARTAVYVHNRLEGRTSRPAQALVTLIYDHRDCIGKGSQFDLEMVKKDARSLERLGPIEVVRYCSLRVCHE